MQVGRHRGRGGVVNITKEEQSEAALESRGRVLDFAWMIPPCIVCNRTQKAARWACLRLEEALNSFGCQKRDVCGFFWPWEWHTVTVCKLTKYYQLRRGVFPPHAEMNPRGCIQEEKGCRISLHTLCYGGRNPHASLQNCFSISSDSLDWRNTQRCATRSCFPQSLSSQVLHASGLEKTAAWRCLLLRVPSP